MSHRHEPARLTVAELNRFQQTPPAARQEPAPTSAESLAKWDAFEADNRALPPCEQRD